MRCWIFPLAGILLSSLAFGAPLQSFIHSPLIRTTLEKILSEMNKKMVIENFFERNRRRLFEPLKTFNRNGTLIARCYFNPISC